MASLVRLLCIAGLAAACGRQPSPPGGSGSPEPATPAPGSGAAPSAPEPPCDVSECGPPMRMPNHRCPDGSMGGPTGRCLRRPDGRCAWEIRACS